MRRPHRIVISWIATLALLMASVAPALAHAIGRQSPATWAEICTSLGARQILVDNDANGKGPQQGPAHLLEHCPYCSLHADAFPVPPAPPKLTEALPLPWRIVPPAFLHAEKTLSVWASAQPRAPPSRI